MKVFRSSSIGPEADDIAAGTQTEHEDGDDKRCGVDGRAERGAELADPDDLIDETGEAGKEEEEE